MADGHLHLVNDVVNGDKNAIKFMKKGIIILLCDFIVSIMVLILATALGRMEELVTEMKNDVNRLPAELVKLPCVTKQLNLSAYNILSKLAHQKVPGNSKTELHKTTVPTTAVVKLSTASTTANTTTTSATKIVTHSSSSNTSSSHNKSNTSVIQQTLNKYISANKVNKLSSTQQPTTTVHSYALQTAGGSLLLYNTGGSQSTGGTQYVVGSNTGSAQQFALAPSTGGSSSSTRHTQYIQGTDGNLYAITTRPSQGQNIVLSTSQGVIYWPVQQSSTTQATAIITQQSQQQYATTATMPGSAVIAKENSKGKLVPTAITVATPITSTATTKTTVVPSTSTATQVSVITID